MDIFRLLHVLPSDSWGQPELMVPEPLIERVCHPGRKREQNELRAALHPANLSAQATEVRKDYTSSLSLHLAVKAEEVWIAPVPKELITCSQIFYQVAR